MDAMVWRAAVRKSDLSEAERRALRSACRRDSELAAQLDYVLPHLALDLSGDFLHHLVRWICEGEADPVMRALAETIGTPGRELRARLEEMAERSEQ